MVRELAEGRGLPVQEIGLITPYRQEGSQTPLYYGVAALLTSWIDISDFDQRYVYNPFGQAGIPGTLVNANMMRHSVLEDFPWTGVTLAVHVLRWFSLLLGIGTILLTQRIAELLFPGRRVLALLAAAITAFNPMFLFMSAAVNNDNALRVGARTGDRFTLRLASFADARLARVCSPWRYRQPLPCSAHWLVVHP